MRSWHEQDLAAIDVDDLEVLIASAIKHEKDVEKEARRA